MAMMQRGPGRVEVEPDDSRRVLRASDPYVGPWTGLLALREQVARWSDVLTMARARRMSVWSLPAWTEQPISPP